MQAEGDSTPVHVALPYPNVHTNAIHKMWIYTIWNRIFTIKMWGHFKLILTACESLPIKLKVNLPFKVATTSYFSFKNPPFPLLFSVAVARCSLEIKYQ